LTDQWKLTKQLIQFHNFYNTQYAARLHDCVDIQVPITDRVMRI